MKKSFRIINIPKLSNKYLVCFIFSFYAVSSFSQTTINGRFEINGVDNSPVLVTSQYTVSGNFTDPKGIYYPTDVSIGDCITDGEGKMTLLKTH